VVGVVRHRVRRHRCPWLLAAVLAALAPGSLAAQGVESAAALEPASRAGAAAPAVAPIDVAEDATRVAVLPPRADVGFETLAEGAAVYVRERLGASGLDVQPRADTLAALGARAKTPFTSRDLPEIVGTLGAGWVVLLDFRQQDGLADVRALLYDLAPAASGEAELLAAKRASGPLASLGELMQTNVAALIEGIGESAAHARAATPPRLIELAAYTRSVRALDAGQYARAWRELEGRSLPPAELLRREITQAAQGAASAGDRARLLVAQGDIEKGWTLVRDELATTSEPTLLLAGADAAVARHNPRQASELYARAAELDPKSADAHLGLGQALAVAKRAEEAGRALDRAAELDPADTVPLLTLAQLHADVPEKEAGYRLEAGRRAAARFDTGAANRELAAAADLDPNRRAATRREQGALHARIGEHPQALAAYEEAAGLDATDEAAWRGLGAQRRIAGDGPGAEAALVSALDLRPDDPEALRALGEIYTETGRPHQAVPKLERALALAPASDETRRSLARALHEGGDADGALALLGPGKSGKSRPEDLALAAELHAKRGDPAAAQLALEQAVSLEPDDPPLREALARLQEARGDLVGAKVQRAVALQLDGKEAAGGAKRFARKAGGGDAGETRDEASLFDELLASFPLENPITRAPVEHVVLVGVREEWTTRDAIRGWLHPRRLDLQRIAAELERAAGARFVLMPLPENAGDVAQELARMRSFVSTREDVALVNDLFEADGAIVVKVLRPRGESKAKAPLQIDIRMLVGRSDGAVAVLANSAILPTGAEMLSTWNERAAAPYLLLLVLVALPFVRGFGTLEVGVEYEARGKGFFSIRIAKRPQKSKTGDRKKDANKVSKYQARFSSLSRYQRHMVGRLTTFRFMPAKRTLYVGVHGLLQEPGTGEVIGNYFEERTVRLARGETVRLDYDFRPKECSIEVTVVRGEESVKNASVALRGQPASLKYARDGQTHLYVGIGNHVVLVGHGDRVAARDVRVTSLDKVTTLVDLANPEVLVFEGCPKAVEPYLVGDLVNAAKALEAAGQTHPAHLVRAAWHLSRDEKREAAAHFEAAGRLEDAAELRAQTGDSEDQKRSATLFQKAGDLSRAARKYKESGDLLEAARAFEATYDYEAAIECYRDVGELDKVMELLEKTGGFMEAALIARERGNLERAIHDLQQIDIRQPDYAEACQILADICEERGDFEMAIAKLEEATRAAGGEGAPLPLQERLAKLHESAGNADRALSVWDGIRRRDLNYPGVATRIEELRKQVSVARSSMATIATPVGGAPSPAPAAPRESRYEILGELGRGGMGIVHKARDKRLGRVVALKRLPESLRENETAVQLFLREARAAAALNHPNIVTLFDADQEDGNYFITMEMLEGVPVNKLLAKHKRLSGRDVAKIGAQIATGLAFAHDRKIVHRDIKTANLFFTRDKIVKIMDFGLAKMLEEVRRSATVIGGTPYYMAPEQAAGGNVDHRADLYAFGVTLFELVTGSVPYPDGDVTYHHRHTPAPDPRTRAEGVPDALAELILQLMEKDPARRPASTSEVGARLAAIAQGKV
jgi:tetratricopeptide (TPR) repeat protein